MGIKGEAGADGISPVLARLTAVAKFGHRPTMQAIGAAWLRQVQAEFVTRTDPYGLPWKKLAALTIRAKKAAGNPQPNRQLFATGGLSRSFGFTAGPKRARIESSMPELAEKHNTGGGPASNFPFATVPQRQIIPDAENLPATWRAGLDEAFADLRVFITR